MDKNHKKTSIPIKIANTHQGMAKATQPPQKETVKKDDSPKNTHPKPSKDSQNK